MKIKITDPSSKMKTKTPVESFTNPQLNEWCARAQKLTQVSEFYWKDVDGNTVYDGVRYSPTTNDAQAMGLLKAYWSDFVLYMVECFGMEWMKQIDNNRDMLNVYIIRAVIASKYGEYVEVDE